MSPSLFEALQWSGATCPLPGWRVLEATGRDAERFLHSQLTADVRELSPGESRLSALLDRGARLHAFFFVLRQDHGFRLLVPLELVRTTMDRLERHVIADHVSLRAIDVPEMQLVLGPVAAELGPTVDRDQFFPLEIYGHRGFVTWSGATIDLPNLEEQALNSLRVVTGLPRWAVEVREGQLVNETTLVNTAVSHSKGCYLGQETVNKVHTHRGAAYAPMLLEVDDGSIDPVSLVGRVFNVGGKKGGTVLAAARWHGGAYLQASLRRELRVHGKAIACTFDDEPEIPVRVLPIPLMPVPSPRDSAQTLLDRAATLYAADREEEAMRLLVRAIAVCPDAADAYEALGVIHGRRGEYERAIELMQRLAEVDPGSIMAHSNLSLYYNKLGRIDDAERELAEATRTDFAAKGRARKRDAEAAEHRRAEAEDLARREAMFRQVLEIDGDDPLANFSMGELFVESERFAEAIPLLRHAIEVDPHHAAAYLALGRALEGTGELAEALEVYTTGIAAAAAKGALMTANQMQGRLAALGERAAAASA